MYNVKNTNFNNKNIRLQKVYIASKIESERDKYGNIIPKYSKPVPYLFNVMPLTESSDIQAFGESSNNMKITILDYKLYKNKFHDFDLCYLDGYTPDNEEKHGQNANYYIYTVREQNSIIKLYFKKLIKGGNNGNIS